ncbi:MAG TPA: DUF3761 domain-containing protein [Gaiellaceae bacterium]|nr:DUF3761 domain-containing protein [Gaiellaceae bacterium]
MFRWGIAASLVLAFGCAGAAAGGVPTGATARCTDGSYSYARHHSGACSRHGGVRAWLTTAPATTAAGTAEGASVLLAPRSRSSDCVLGPMPDRACSPGAYATRLTKAVICSPSFTTSSVRDVSEAEKHAVEREYGMEVRSYGSTLEIDHIVPLELGGSNAIANLFPEKAAARPGYHVKDRLEDRLASLVCGGSMSIDAARRGIAANWERLYRQVFGRAAV